MKYNYYEDEKEFCKDITDGGFGSEDNRRCSYCGAKIENGKAYIQYEGGYICAGCADEMDIFDILELLEVDSVIELIENSSDKVKYN